MAERTNYHQPPPLKRILTGTHLRTLRLEGITQDDSVFAKELIDRIRMEEFSAETAANIYNHFLRVAINVLNLIRDNQTRYMEVERARYSQNTIILGLSRQTKTTAQAIGKSSFDHLARGLHTTSFDEIFTQLPEITMATIRSILNQTTQAEEAIRRAGQGEKTDLQIEMEIEEVRDEAEEKTSLLRELHAILIADDTQTKLLLKWFFDQACQDAKVHFLREEISDAVTNCGVVRRGHPEIIAYAAHRFL